MYAVPTTPLATVCSETAKQRQSLPQGTELPPQPARPPSAVVREGNPKALSGWVKSHTQKGESKRISKKTGEVGLVTEEEVGAIGQAQIGLSGWERSLPSRVDMESWSQMPGGDSGVGKD